MRIIDFEKLIIKQLLNEAEFKEFLEETPLNLDLDMEGHTYSSNTKVENVEASALEYLEEIGSILSLTETEIEECVDSMDNESKAKLITDNLKLVSYLGMLMLKDGIDFMDLVQEGTVGLIQGVESYSTSSYNCLKTYLSVNIVRKMVLYTYERFEEKKSEFLSYFNEKAEEYSLKEQLGDGISKKMKEIMEINYFYLLNSITPIEKAIVSMYYGFTQERNISMYEIEKKLGIEHGDGDAIFQIGINKISRFGGELFQI
ncbi:MAG: sigma-70 family RNA polymerase sigma factor [Fusobacteriaceae bacterium]